MLLGVRGIPKVQGEVETHAELLYARLSRDVEVIVRSPCVSPEQKQFGPIKVSRIWSPTRPGFEALVRSLLGDLYAGFARPDVLQIHAVGPAAVTPLARLLGLKVVVTHRTGIRLPRRKTDLSDNSKKLRNFLILGTQRTGSQALYGALNLHPEVVCGGEWTFKSAWYEKISKAEQALAGDFQELLVRPRLQERYANAVTPETRWLGFKILFRSSAKWLGIPALAPALWIDRLEGHLQWLRRRPDIHVIQLVRRDPLEWLKSKYLSRESGMYVNKQYPEEMKVRIPVGPALRAVAAKRWVDDRLAGLAASNPYHPVEYEDFLADNRRELESCLTFLGCDPDRLPVEGPYRKRQSKVDASRYIKNYDELVAALKRNGAWPPGTAPQ